MSVPIQALQISLQEREIRQPGPKRAWMDSTKNAYRCLPLVMANQLGWELILECDVWAIWLGIDHQCGIRILRGREAAASHFGWGILTFHMYHMFLTPPEINLLVTGPANRPKRDIYALEGLVETDHTHMSFTMNWRFTRAFRLVRFRAGEPICRVLPYPRDYFEQFELEKVPWEEIPQPMRDQHYAWGVRRAAWIQELEAKGEEKMKADHGSSGMHDYAQEAKQTKIHGCPRAK